MDGEWLGLTGRVCVVTGAGGGLGRAIATGLAAAGGRLVLLDRDAATCEETAQKIGGWIVVDEMRRGRSGSRRRRGGSCRT